MGKADIAANTYLAEPERFADVVNHGLYGGLPVVKAWLLEDLDSAAGGYGRTAKTRDIIKKLYDRKMVISIIGIENQTNIHYAMPLKNMWYDLDAYEKQRIQIARQHCAEGDLKGDEWLCKFGKKDKLIPVVTLVLYYGTESWDAPLSLHSMLQISPQFQTFQSLYSDYHVNLLEVSKIEDWDSYSDDLKIVFGFVKYQKDKESMRQYMKEHETLFQTVSQENYMAIEALTRTDVRKYVSENEKETIDMCQAWEDLKNDAIQEGLSEGRAQGRAQGRTEGDSLRLISLIRKKVLRNKTLNQTADELEDTPEHLQPLYDLICGLQNDKTDGEIYNEYMKMSHSVSTKGI